jgi:hypothetical protein
MKEHASAVSAGMFFRGLFAAYKPDLAMIFLPAKQGHYTRVTKHIGNCILFKHVLSKQCSLKFDKALCFSKKSVRPAIIDRSILT